MKTTDIIKMNIQDRVYKKSLEYTNKTFLIETPERVSHANNLYWINEEYFSRRFDSLIQDYKTVKETKEFMKEVKREIENLDNSYWFTDNTIWSYQAAINQLQRKVDFNLNDFVANMNWTSSLLISEVKILKMNVEIKVLQLAMFQFFLEKIETYLILLKEVDKIENWFWEIYATMRLCQMKRAYTIIEVIIWVTVTCLLWATIYNLTPDLNTEVENIQVQQEQRQTQIQEHLDYYESLYN